MTEVRIVGWVLEPNNHCACGKLANVIVANSYDHWESCKDCVPSGTSDEIAKIFARAFSTQLTHENT